ncbi:N-alpha-acetyltransferase 38, NatC auxiliary subunit isoform X2 [Sceloporus undulatus]|uniref:N-alpha-acetyltransferase 38, NatC auxiliary subunit isoform X2 n=1 Tax=Sceloporus undulatus TaxID=8520 RepID=UPI001C4B0D64|nr:N-alpha-acetyltransferase 38, NatC auxiliary subunit isoform X2 [Sceloporus undulatus]
MAAPAALAVVEPLAPQQQQQQQENGCSGKGPEDLVEDKADSPYLHARRKLENLLNKSMRIRMTDGRTLVGCFLCTDRDCNVILGSAQEYLKASGFVCSRVEGLLKTMLKLQP